MTEQITQAGVYFELEGETADITQAGVYFELEGEVADITQVGVYFEMVPLFSAENTPTNLTVTILE